MEIEAGKTGRAKGISTYNRLDKDDLNIIINNEKEIALSIILDNREPIPTCIKTRKLYFAGPWFTEKSAAFYNAILLYSYSFISIHAFYKYDTAKYDTILFFRGKNSNGFDCLVYFFICIN